MHILTRYTEGPYPCTYLAEQQTTLACEIVARLSPAEYETRMNQGWRKFGRFLFRPVCAGCQECRPIRIPLARFAPDRSQKRALQRNADLVVRHQPPALDAQRLALYQRYHDAQTERKGWPKTERDGEDYYAQFVDNPIPSVEISVWEGELLRGIVLTDITPNAVSAVYHYHDPIQRERSLGTFLILQSLLFAQRMEKSYCYLGFYVADCASMNYKRRYQPCEILGLDGSWHEVSRE